MKNRSNWTCPYCRHAQTITDDRYIEIDHRLNISGHKDGRINFYLKAVVCANSDCKNLVLAVKVYVSKSYTDNIDCNLGLLGSWQLIPQSDAKPQPEFIPEPIRNDYYEACAIRDLSPKASATLTRRCLQGMIRDFFDISKPTLNAEINELRRQADNKETKEPITFDVLDAIDHVRKIGNIGAHMEKDINVVVDVDPDEAQILIELIEMLFEDWYISREQRRQRLSRLKQVASDKEALKKLPAPPLQLSPPETRTPPSEPASP